MEFIESKAYNEKIINSSSIMNNDELINRSFSDIVIINSYDEEQFIKDFFEWVKKSIFFNKYIDTLKEIYNNILKIKEKYINKNYYFSNLDIQSINDDIKIEFLKIMNEEDLKEINNIIYEQQKKDLEENDIKDFKIIHGGSGFFSVGFFSLFLYLWNPLFLIGIGVVGGINYYFFRARKKKIYSIIDENFEKSYKKFERRYILINIYLIRKKAENYNKVIDEFNKYINDFINDDDLTFEK